MSERTNAGDVIPVVPKEDRKRPGKYVARAYSGKVVLPVRGESFSRSTRFVEVVREKERVILAKTPSPKILHELAEKEAKLQAETRKRDALEKRARTQSVQRSWILDKAWSFLRNHPSHTQIHAAVINDLQGACESPCARCNLEHDDVVIALDAGITHRVACPVCCNSVSCKHHIKLEERLKEMGLQLADLGAKEKLLALTEWHQKRRTNIWRSCAKKMISPLEVGSKRWLEVARIVIKMASDDAIWATTITYGGDDTGLGAHGVATMRRTRPLLLEQIDKKEDLEGIHEILTSYPFVCRKSRPVVGAIIRELKNGVKSL